MNAVAWDDISDRALEELKKDTQAGVFPIRWSDEERHLVSKVCVKLGLRALHVFPNERTYESSGSVRATPRRLLIK